MKTCPTCGAPVKDEEETLPESFVELWNNPKDRVELNMRNMLAAKLKLPEMKSPRPR